MFAAIALKLLPVRRFLKAIPRPVWIALAVVALLLLGNCAHKRSVAKFGAERFAAGVTYQKALQAEVKKEAEAAGNKISKEIRSESDEKARDINSRADGLRVSGPGRARCAVPPAAPSGPKPASGNGNDAGPPVPPADSAAVPWPWLVQRAEQADLNRNEVLAWREWHRRLTEEWSKHEQRN